LPASHPEAEPLIGELSSQRGSNDLGPFAVSSGRIALYFRCAGVGTALISISGVGEFPNDCDPTGQSLGVRNTFDVRYVKDYTVTVAAENTLLWSVSITSNG
jgi:hypothetical protein